jgi:serine/threonine protein kinase
MSLCINPRCPQPDHPGNDNSLFCQSCGSELVLQQRYRVMRLLSDSSGFGKVYEAYERSTPKILKVLKESHNANAKAVELFKQEAIVLQQLKHPGVPKIEPDGYFEYYAREVTEPLHCIIMEKIDGPTLMQWMHQQGGHPISEKQALNWLHQLAEVLHLVHQKHYFHRDIKPQNIMIRPNGQLVLIDFGAAREMTYSYLAQVGGMGMITRISSAGYTPPEQEQGQALPQSDFYALGRTFVYLITGKELTDSGVYDSMTNEIHWKALAPQISQDFANFIDRLIAYRAADRPKSTQEILETIQHLKGDLDQKPEYGADLPTQLSPPKHKSKLRWLVGSIAALALFTGGVALWQYRPFQTQVPIEATIAPTQTLQGHTSFVNAVVFSPDGKTLISAGADKSIKIWDLSTGRVIRDLQGHTSFVNALAVSPDGQIIVSASADKTIKIWEYATGQEVRTLTGHGNFVNALTISTDGQTLASAGADRIIRLWKLPSGKALKTLEGHTGFINALLFSSDGQMLISGGADKTIKLWDVTTGKETRNLTGHKGFINAVAIRSDGQILASASADKTIKIWDINTGKELYTLTGHANYVNALAISPDGETLVSASADKTFKFWNLSKGELSRTMTGYNHPINYFAVSPGWQTIATGSGDRTISIWQLP